MSVDLLLPTLSELQNLPAEERARLRAIEDAILDRVLASLDRTRREGGDSDFVLRALVPVLLSIAARAYSDVAEGSEANPQQFLSLARESLGWAHDRESLCPVVKH